MKLKPIIEEKAKKRMLAGKSDPTQKSAEGETREELAKLAGVSRNTITKAQIIKKEGIPEQIGACVERRSNYAKRERIIPRQP